MVDRIASSTSSACLTMATQQWGGKKKRKGTDDCFALTLPMAREGARPSVCGQNTTEKKKRSPAAAPCEREVQGLSSV